MITTRDILNRDNYAITTSLFKATPELVGHTTPHGVVLSCEYIAEDTFYIVFGDHFKPLMECEGVVQ